MSPEKLLPKYPEELDDIEDDMLDLKNISEKKKNRNINIPNFTSLSNNRADSFQS